MYPSSSENPCDCPRQRNDVLLITQSTGESDIWLGTKSILVVRLSNRKEIKPTGIISFQLKICALTELKDGAY